jgi:hypothetical protein
MKRVIVQEGKRGKVADATSSEVTSTQEVSRDAEGKLERSPSDLERGLSRGEDDVEDKKGENEEGYAKK